MEFIKLYVNHRLVEDSSIPSSLSLKYNLGFVNRIGTGIGTSGHNFGGLLDELKIRNTASDDFVHGHDIAYFSADAYDFENAISNVYWNSSIAGLITYGYSWQFNSTTLAFGNHTITFQVEDEYGVLSDEVSSYFVILAHPESNISSVSSQALNYGVPLSFVGNAKDRDRTHP